MAEQKTWAEGCADSFEYPVPGNLNGIPVGKVRCKVCTQIIDMKAITLMEHYSWCMTKNVAPTFADMRTKPEQ